MIKSYQFGNYPEIILADEPTCNLDPQTYIELLQILKDLNEQGKTIVIATHDHPHDPPLTCLLHLTGL